MSSITKLNRCKTFEPEIFNAVYPIVAVKVYRNGVMEIVRKSKLQGKPISPDGRKGKEIVKFTNKSMSQLIATINATEIDFNSMVTLTYPAIYPKNGRDVKRHLNSFLNMFRRKFKTEYLWFLEFQSRGAPHFHFLTEYDAITPALRVSVCESWVSGMSKSDWIWDQAAEMSVYKGCECEYDIVADNLSKSYRFTFRRDTIELLRDKDGARKYVTKYASKEFQKKPPSDYSGVGRFWGCSEGVKLSGEYVTEKSEDEVRKFLASQDHACGEWDVLPKFLFNIKGID